MEVGSSVELSRVVAGKREGEKVVWAVGTTNRAKLASVHAVVQRCFPRQTHDVVACEVPSGVRAQPMSAGETQRGALARARAALRCLPHADFGVGLEGGIEHVSLAEEEAKEGKGEGERNDHEEGERYFECGWMAVVERQTGRVGLGSSARFEMSPALMTPILTEGKELAEVMDALTGEQDVRSGLGAMGVLTAGVLDRATAYSHGLIFALAPFLSDTKYWGQHASKS
ncbi:unnamed protein product [Phytomonas sp. EM1]|nr:unnamed protein product [Phytomonas sp. EM1]|eukprot:CCW62887.1 unnamed protein product [Phytomonas sp. isolate EM1]